MILTKRSSVDTQDSELTNSLHLSPSILVLALVVSKKTNSGWFKQEEIYEKNIGMAHSIIKRTEEPGLGLVTRSKAPNSAADLPGGGLTADLLLSTRCCNLPHWHCEYQIWDGPAAHHHCHPRSYHLHLPPLPWFSLLSQPSGVPTSQFKT